jgi:hypothetical protein
MLLWYFRCHFAPLKGLIQLEITSKNTNLSSDHCVLTSSDGHLLFIN